MIIKTDEIINNIAGSWKGKRVNDFTHFSVDSRNIKSGSFFIALEGQKVDGHDFISDAIQRGAKGIAIQKPYNNNFFKDTFVYKVESTKNFLLFAGELARKKFQNKIIGITGSAGKTTTKEMISLILAKKFNIAATKGNANTEISIPLFLLNDTNGDEDYLVVEMGIQKRGDMDTLNKVLQPNIALLLNIGDSHLEFLKNREGVAQEKFKLIQFVKENNGKIILNGDDPLIQRLSNKTDALYFSTKRNGEVRGNIIESTEQYMKIKFFYKNKCYVDEFPFSGIHFLYDMLASLSLGIIAGIPINKSIAVLKTFTPAKGRGTSMLLSRGITIIDETYNSNPVSLVANLSRFTKHKAPLIIVVGDMLELGKNAKLLHKKTGESIARVKPKLLISIGKYAEDILSGAKLNGIEQGIAFTCMEKARTFIKELKICQNSVIFIKGSRDMKMEEIVEILKKRFGK